MSAVERLRRGGAHSLPVLSRRQHRTHPERRTLGRHRAPAGGNWWRGPGGGSVRRGPMACLRLRRGNLVAQLRGLCVTDCVTIAIFFLRYVRNHMFDSHLGNVC